MSVDARNWYRAAENTNLACAGDATQGGSYSCVSPLVGYPDLFASRLGTGNDHWGTTILWLDDTTRQIRLLSECGYHEGRVRNVRTFWGADGRAGTCWLPYDIPTDRPLKFQTLGRLVEQAIAGDDGRPYTTDPTHYEAGAIIHDEIVAATTVSYVGSIRIGVDDVEVIRRQDVMGHEPANVETYDIGRGRGTYSVVRWRSEEARVPRHDIAATVIVPMGSPCWVYGTTPDGVERWFVTPGCAKPAPFGSRPTPRPLGAMPQARPARRSWIERMGL